MNITQESKRFSETEEYAILRAELGDDAMSEIWAILRILEIGNPSIAHSKRLLHVCEDMLEKCSLTFGTRRDE